MGWLSVLAVVAILALIPLMAVAAQNWYRENLVADDAARQVTAQVGESEDRLMSAGTGIAVGSYRTLTWEHRGRPMQTTTAAVDREAGTTTRIWVDGDGQLRSPPQSSTRHAVGAAGAALMVWVILAVTIVGVLILMSAGMAHVSRGAWDREWYTLNQRGALGD